MGGVLWNGFIEGFTMGFIEGVIKGFIDCFIKGFIEGFKEGFIEGFTFFSSGFYSVFIGVIWKVL